MDIVIILCGFAVCGLSYILGIRHGLTHVREEREAERIAINEATDELVRIVKEMSTPHIDSTAHDEANEVQHIRRMGTKADTGQRRRTTDRR